MADMSDRLNRRGAIDENVRRWCSAILKRDMIIDKLRSAIHVVTYQYDYNTYIYHDNSPLLVLLLIRDSLNKSTQVKRIAAICGTIFCAFYQFTNQSVGWEIPTCFSYPHKKNKLLAFGTPALLNPKAYTIFMWLNPNLNIILLAIRMFYIPACACVYLQWIFIYSFTG